MSKFARILGKAAAMRAKRAVASPMQPAGLPGMNPALGAGLGVGRPCPLGNMPQQMPGAGQFGQPLKPAAPMPQQPVAQPPAANPAQPNTMQNAQAIRNTMASKTMTR